MRQRYGTLAAALLVAVGTSCSGETDPLGSSGGSSSNVTFNFAGVTAGAGHDVCAEIDGAELVTTPTGRTAAMQQKGPQNCQADFRVTVPKGQVEFSGLLRGGGRPVFRGSTVAQIEEDGFRIVIDLDEIDALNVRTRTLGPYGPSHYRYQYAGAPDFELIGKDDTVTVAALAGGDREVTLDPRPCRVVNGPPQLDVPIPTDETTLGDHGFEVDCNIGGGLTVVVETFGPGPSSYTVDVTSDTDAFSSPIGRNETQFFGAVGPGPIGVDLTIPGPPLCQVTSVPGDPFMNVDGSLTVTFTVNCTQSTPMPPPPPPPPPPPVNTGTIEIKTQAPAPPPIGSTPTFDYVIRDASGAVVRSGTIGVNTTLAETGIPVSGNDHTVILTQTGTCTVDGTGMQTVTVPTNGSVRAGFEVRC